MLRIYYVNVTPPNLEVVFKPKSSPMKSDSHCYNCEGNNFKSTSCNNKDKVPCVSYINDTATNLINVLKKKM